MRRPCVNVAHLALSLLLVTCLTTRTRGGEIWTDGNGDGLPDPPGTLVAAFGDSVEVDVWIDAQSFAWTNFLAYVEWDGSCFQYVSAEYLIAGGSNFPIDRFSHPSAVGFGGFGYTEGGVDRIGRFTLELVAQAACCVTPIIDPKNSYGVFSQLGAESAYFLFTSNPGSCWSPLPGIEACCFPNGTCVEADIGMCPAGSTPRGPGTSCADPCPVLPGACCLPGGACTGPLTRDACEAQGGVYQGDGTDCGGVSCPLPTGACCFSDDTCQDGLSRDNCEAGGGIYRGNGTACDGGQCPVLPGATGACCFSDDTCQGDVSPNDCEASGGIYMGDETACDGGQCPVLVGACCFEVDQCMVITGAACADSGGVFFGQGSQCEVNGDCTIQTGACCGPTGSCSLVLTREECESRGSVYQGDAVPCAPGLCPDLRGACCFLNGSCQLRFEADCASAGGVFQGSGTTCAQVDCPDFRGACCLPNGNCQLRFEADCASVGGVFQGIGTTCPSLCPDMRGACCLPSGSCQYRLEADCVNVGGVFQGTGTTCAQVDCVEFQGACCLPEGGCRRDISRLECEQLGGWRWSETEDCTPTFCTDECAPNNVMAQIPVALREAEDPLRKKRSSRARASERTMGAQATPCLLPSSTNGTAANYRWYNVCSGYIWIFNDWCAGEGVGVLFGGPSQPEVSGDNNVGRAITYYRNVVYSYNNEINVFIDVDNEGDGCPDYTIASDLFLSPALRWNCSEFNVDIPCGVEYLIVRTVHALTDLPRNVSFATDGPYSANCDPNSAPRSFYYGLGDVCQPWLGPNGNPDNFLYWLILDSSEPCVNAVESTSWGRIKGLFR